jgi:hypothetical protein
MFDTVKGYDVYARVVSVDGSREYVVVNNNSEHWVVLDRPTGDANIEWVKVASFRYGPSEVDSENVYWHALGFVFLQLNRR